MLNQAWRVPRTAGYVYNRGMLELSRTVRFCLSDGSAAGGSTSPRATPTHNTYSAWPAMRGLGRYYELDVICRGQADPQTGYFINIKHIDQAVRDEVLPYLEDLLNKPIHSAALPMGALMQNMLPLLQPRLHDTVAEVRLHLTPRYSLAIRSYDMQYVIIRQQYEFSAAHRLHVPELSDEQNRQIFGKCNNPAGHGHNYRVEVALRMPIDPAGDTLCVEELDELVNTHVIEKLDHKHLNQDVPQFKDQNPSVEHIAQVIWQMLADKVAKAGTIPGGSLEEIRVWETEKTACIYRGQGDQG